MRLFFIVLLAVLAIAPNGWADDIDTALGDTVSAEVKALTRAAVGPQVTQESAIRMAQVMAAHQFSNANMVRALQSVIDTQQQQLPVDPVMNKAFEGIAKKASDAAIVAAMDRTQSRFAFSRQKALALSSRPDVVDALTSLSADALAAGMRTQDMDRIAAQLQQQTKARARTMSEDEDTQVKLQTMMTVRTMARFGVPSSVVADVTSQAVAHQFTQQEMAAVRSQFAQQAQSRDAVAVAGRFGDAIGRGARGSDIGHGGGGGAGGGGAGGSGAGGGGGGAGGAGAGGGGAGGGGAGGGGAGGGGAGGGGGK